MLKCNQDCINEIKLSEISALVALSILNNINISFDILPASLIYLNLAGSSTKHANMKALGNLETLIMSNVVNFKLE